MVERLEEKLLVTPDDFAPSTTGLRVIGAFNPGAVRFEKKVILLVRVAESPVANEPGWLLSPRAALEGGARRYEIDRLRIHPGGDRDHRKPILATGRRRLAFASHLALVRLAADGYTVEEIVREEALFPQDENEIYGVEDARITEIDGTFYITYVSVSEAMGVCTSLMTTDDFRSFERRGVIFPCENKDVVLFPERVDGRYWALHRPVGRINISPLAIVAANSPDLLRWGGHARVLGCAAKPGWYSGRIGAGPPPIRTERGWLTIFHGVNPISADDPIGEYSAGAMLSALDDPTRLVAISPEPFLRPEQHYEVTGYVNSVVFPTGLVRDLDDLDRLHVYYGSADTAVAVVTFSIASILEEMVEV